VNTLKNIIGFNISWLGLVYFGNNFIPVASLFLLIHLFFISKIKNELLFVIAASLIGIIVDSIFLHLGFFVFEGELGLPMWLIMLWGCFAATLCHSLQFIDSSFWFKILAGLIAPFSYFSGSQLGVVEFGHPWLITYLILALIWPLIFIVFFSLKSLLLSKEFNNV
jgi:hypothetical protein